jgi:hypothetical protein
MVKIRRVEAVFLAGMTPAEHRLLFYKRLLILIQGDNIPSQ